MAQKVTSEQLQQRYATYLDTYIQKVEKAGGRVTKHDQIRALIIKGASNGMVEAVCTARKGQSQPKIKRADIRWNRNQWIKEDPDVAIGHADADKKEKNATGTILEPCRETVQLDRATATPPKSDTADTEPPKPTTKKKTSKKKTGKKKPAAPESDQPAAPESDQPSAEEPVAPGKPRDIDPADIEF